MESHRCQDALAHPGGGGFLLYFATSEKVRRRKVFLWPANASGLRQRAILRALASRHQGERLIVLIAGSDDV